MGTADGPVMAEIGILLALLSACAASVSFLCKARGAVAAPDVEVRHPLRSAAALFRSRWWTIGFAIAAAAWVLHVAALSVAPLSLVQAVLAGGLVLISWPAERWFGCRIGRREWLGLGLAAVGLAFLAATASGQAHDSGYSVAGMIAFEGAAIALGLSLLLSAHRGEPRPHHGLLIAAAGGVMMGVANVALKLLVDTVPGSLGAILSPWTLVVILAGVGAFYALARSLQVGQMIQVVTVTSVATTCATVLGGIVVFGDPVGGDVLEGLARGGAFAMVIAAAVLMPAPLRAAGARA
jgi:hypothetical protein